jgi:hypothetical protein
MPLSDYKDIFGKPGEGGHAYRIFDIAIVDVIFTIIGGYMIANLLNWSKTKTIVDKIIFNTNNK